MKHELLTALLFFTPAYISNASCALVTQIPYIKSRNLPISKKFLGTHKTWAGLILGTLIGTLLGFAIYLLSDFGNFTLAFMGAFGALFGDAIKSYFKRRLNIPAGAPFVPFDQIDLVVGSLILQSIFTPIPNYVIILGLLITPILHFGTNVIAYKLKLKKVWW